MSSSNQLILLLDDDQDILTLYHDSLECWGYQTISFDNPIDALNYMCTDNNISKCSLIITDYRMPQMNGLDFIQHIRERYSNGSQNKIYQLKVILISAFVISELTLTQTVLNLKIDKILEKPIPLELFKQEVENLIRK
ncbi:MAG TPA: response regulator [Nitrososphaeraceae archaeon]|nr:response regulator [Nitrososphaeraceae archaeon]